MVVLIEAGRHKFFLWKPYPPYTVSVYNKMYCWDTLVGNNPIVAIIKQELKVKGITMSDSKPNWYVKVELTVIGPGEGPVKSEVEYQSTTKEMATGIQNELAHYFVSKNG
jgi:hypothetical protein